MPSLRATISCGAVVVIGLPSDFQIVAISSKPDGKGKVSKQSDGV